MGCLPTTYLNKRISNAVHTVVASVKRRRGAARLAHGMATGVQVAVQRSWVIPALLLGITTLSAAALPAVVHATENGITGDTAQGGLISKKVTSEDWLQSTEDGGYTVDGLSPSNATINVFDYWLEEQDTVDARQWKDANNAATGVNYKTNSVSISDQLVAAHWGRSDFLGGNSINRSETTIHPFVFAGITQTDNWRFGVDGFEGGGGKVPDPDTWLKNDDGHAPRSLQHLCQSG